MNEMNLGEANLRTVNTSRPKLIHVDSKQSITASDDYYSLGSDGSGTGDRTINEKFETPPSQTQSAAPIPGVLPQSTTNPTIRPVRNSPPEIITTAPAVVRFEESQTVKQKLASGEGPRLQRAGTDKEITPTTPGVDDTPYIRFAIDQLTRDEELLGPRRQDTTSEASYPVDRIVPDEGLGYYGHTHQSTRHERQPPNPPSKHSESPRK